jgi:hypothetical protein
MIHRPAQTSRAIIASNIRFGPEVLRKVKFGMWKYLKILYTVAFTSE